MSTTFEKKFEVLLKRSPQLHKYRYSNPVRRNVAASALTLLAGQKPAAHAGQEQPEEPIKAATLPSNRQSSWQGRSQPPGQIPTSETRPEACASSEDTRFVGKRTPQAHTARRSRRYKHLRAFCKTFVERPDGNLPRYGSPCETSVKDMVFLSAVTRDRLELYATIDRLE